MIEKNQKKVAIIQARMGSSRLPGKVLKNIAGKPMLAYVCERICLSKLINHIVVATTDETSDDPIANYCMENDISCFRGKQFDVLDRFYQAALIFKADIIVRITADCPLIDPEMIDDVIESFINQEVDFAANRLPPPWKRSFPIGLDIEVSTFSALEKAWKEATLEFEREHVMPFLYDHPNRFKTLLIHHEPDYGNKRWTVDTQQDFDMVEKIIEHFFPTNDFSWLDVLDFVHLNPEIELINKQVAAKFVQSVDERVIANNRKDNL
ncbi:MAG: acylneuraminate cytidylyltransferase [Chloroflexi bacterium HGW-Chloroflexi-8]|jgi:spore coat polysaccharide biosynthesis protein SpsF|nr:MAG: acylneuraminate cytidylyltransferase [Chloroflexi bacterium HGW-Chloroflexi-8]